MAKEDTPKDEGQAAEGEGAPKKKSKKMLFIILAAAIVVLGGGGAAAFLFMGGEKAPEEGAHQEAGTGNPEVDALHAEAADPHGEIDLESHDTGHEEEDSHGGGHGEEAKEDDGHGGGHGAEEPVDPGPPLLRLQPITVNLGSTRRIVIAEIWLEANDHEDLAFVERNEHHLKDALVFLFSGKTVEDVTSQEGQELLRREIMARVNRTIAKGKIKAVGFDNLVVR